MINLLYYDMKAVVKRCWYYIIIFALLAVLVRFLFTDAFIAFFTDINFIYGIVIRVVAGGFLAAFGILVVLIVVVCQAQWFDENILSSQGQLTNMLPVASWQIILSKIITTIIWSIILVGMTVGVACVVLAGTDYFKDFAQMVVEVGVDNQVNISVSKLIISVAIYFMTGLTSFVTLCYVSQMIGQMFSGLRNLMIFIAFVVVLALSLLVEYKAAAMFGIIAPTGIDTANIVSFCIQAMTKLTVMNICAIVVYWFTSSVILKRFLTVV